MNLRIFRIIVFQFFSLTLIVVAQSRSDSELAKIAKSAFEARSKAGFNGEKIPAFRAALDGLSDSEKIRALSSYLFEIDANPRWSMRSGIGMSTVRALYQDPELIRDYSLLRKMISEEQDPRRFYLLSILVPKITDKMKHDFIPERVHMLFKDGRVTKEEGEYTRSYSHDVSEYIYPVILRDLKLLGAEFEPSETDITHEEQVLALARWLKENWQGCASLEIPVNLLNEDKEPLKEKPKLPTKEDEILAPTDESSRIPWIVLGVVLLSILGLLFKKYMRPSNLDS